MKNAKKTSDLTKIISLKKNYTRKCIRAGSYKPSRQLLIIHRTKKSVSTLLNALQKSKKSPPQIDLEVIRTNNVITRRS